MPTPHLEAETSDQSSVSGMGRRRFVKLALGGAGLAAGVTGTGTLVASVRGARTLEVTRHRVPNPIDTTRDIEGRLRLVQLSDLHLRTVSGHQERVAEATHREGPDLILLTGDTLHAGTSISVMETFLGLLPASATKLAIMGNWEHRGTFMPSDFRDSFARAGVQLLLNESVSLERPRGPRLTVSGIDDYLRGLPSWRETFRDVPSQGPHLLLAHCPAHRDALTRDSATQGIVPELVLSGHTHGGQVKVLGRAWALPSGSGPYVEGWYEDDGAPGDQRNAPLYVSRGIGTTFVPIRRGSTPEIAVFDWVGQGG